MRTLLFTCRVLSRGAFVVALGLVAARPAAAQQTFEACYVPAIGALYLINQTGLPTACLSTDHVAISWTESGELADGSVTAVKLADGAVVTIKLADGAVTEAKLGFDPATQAELDALGVAGTINTSTNPVDWTRLKGVPADFADGVDDTGGTSSDVDCTGCVATAELADAAVTEVKLSFDPTTQAELDAYATSLSTTGTINTSTNPVDWTRLKGVPAGFADGTDENTTYAAGNGLTLTAESFAADFAGPGAAGTVARSDHTHEAATGVNNTSVGASALTSNVSGDNIVAVGYQALSGNVGGDWNTAVGSNALRDNEHGAQNVAVGEQALQANLDGSANTGVGRAALAAGTAPEKNTAIGFAALYNATAGEANIALGFWAGYHVTTGSNNIHIGHFGVATDDQMIRIGNGQDSTFIAGIAGTNVAGSQVYVNSSGKLGVTVSSLRYKQDIEALGDVSRRLFDLRPVQFRYRPEYDGSATIQYGLIAEEVEEVFPELVIYDEDGRVQSVRYELLSVLLLNEIQRQEEQLRRQGAELAKLGELEQQVGALRASLEALEEATRRDRGIDER